MPRLRVRNGFVQIRPTASSASSGTVDTSALQAQINTKANSVHTHAISDTTGLQAALDGKQASGTYAAGTHSHVIADTTGLQAALDGKQASGSYASSTHSHAISDVTNLQSELDGKQASGSYAASSHTHIIADTTGLQAALDGKQASGSYANSTHTHVAADITDFTAEVTALVGGGSDPWTTVLLGSDFTISTTANNTVTSFNFTPSSANTLYLVQGYVFLKTATATVGARPGIAWPTGLSYQGAIIQAPNSATAFAFRSFGSTTTANAASTGLVDTTNFHLGMVTAYFRTGASPSGNFQITLASETAATNVTMGANSLLMWRTIT